jgi:hypothetical protein
MQKIWIQSDNVLQIQNAIVGLDEIVDLLDAELGDRH